MCWNQIISFCYEKILKIVQSGQYYITGVCVSQILIKKHALMCKKGHLKYTFLKITHASQELIDQKMCKNCGKCAKTCISNILEPNSKTCIFKGRAAWGRAAHLRPYCILKKVLNHIVYTKIENPTIEVILCTTKLSKSRKSALQFALLLSSAELLGQITFGHFI